MNNADKNPIKGNKKFGIDQPQPSPKAKSDGWARKRGAEAIKDAFLKYSAMSMDDLRKIMININAGNYVDLKGEPLTPADVHAIRHATDKKYTIDYMNRGVEYAKQQLDLSGQQDLFITVKYESTDNNTGILESGDREQFEIHDNSSGTPNGENV